MSNLPTEPFLDPDYRDRFELHPATPFASIEEFVAELVLRQPAWLTKLSMGIGRVARRRTALDRLAAGDGHGIGNWTIVDRGPRHVRFGEDMRIMRYRISYELHDDETVGASTEVDQTSRLCGPIYWTLAVPLHRRFLAMLLHNAGGDGSTAHELPLDTASIAT